MARARPFSLEGALQGGGFRHFGRLTERVLERALALDRLDRLYQSLPPAADIDTFLQQVLDTFGIDYRVEAAELAQIPEEGGVVVVANHPFGALEGVVLAALLRRVRPDVKVMANFLLARVPELAPLFIGVDPFGGREAARRNTAPLREAVRWVRGGGALVIFPAGEVAHRTHPGAPVTDPPWSLTLARLLRLTRAPALPVYFHGANSPLFQILGMVHPRLRTALLPRELLNKARSTLPVRIGALLPFAGLASLKDAALVEALRLRTCMLAEAPSKPLPAQECAVPVADAGPPELLAAEVSALPTDQQLLESGEMVVCWARAEQAPRLLQEIGRLRELTFRETGEGTGRERDIDLYDSYYLHLFVWNRAKGELVGAYRLGLADRIVARYGKRGLYSHSLFRYRSRLLAMLNPAIELGRSFVRAEYQRSFSPLLLLWKGIGAFIARHPRYRILFGPVSISNDYHTLSRRMLVEFLKANNYLPELARHVRARRPFRPGAGAAPLAPPADLEAVSALVAQIEADRKGIPVLLRQYLKMGGRLLGFNVDDQFSDALDGLIMVDLRQTDPRMLARYMGREAAQRFLARHNGASTPLAAGNG